VHELVFNRVNVECRSKCRYSWDMVHMVGFTVETQSDSRKKLNIRCFHSIFISPLPPSPNYDIVVLSFGMHTLTFQYTHTIVKCLSTHKFLHIDVIISVWTSAAAWQRTLRAPYATSWVRGTTSFRFHRRSVREIRRAPWRSLLLLSYASGMGPLHDHYRSVGSRLSR
jgi:hypothetical protein